MPRSIAIFTKTYRADLTAFAELCDSIDFFMPNTRHIVAVDTCDLELFQRFAKPNRELVDCGKFLPGLHEFSLFGRRLWFTRSGRIVRGWIHQQLAKLAIIAGLDVQAVVIVDSDARFVAPLDLAGIFDGERVRMFHKPGAPSGPPEQSPKWHDAAAYALGLPIRGYTGADYISGAVIWSPDVVRAMLRHIEISHDGEWLTPLLKPLRISEYVLYGVFCDHVNGPHRELISPTLAELAHCSWDYDFGQSGGVEQFISELPCDASAVLVQSNLKMPAARRQEIFTAMAERRSLLAATHT